MSFLIVDSVEDYRLTRWVARGLSLLFIGFNVILLLFNEDVGSSPTAGIIAMWILAIAMVIAWRWELAGGVSVMSLSLLFMLLMIYQWSTTDVPVVYNRRLNHAPMGFNRRYYCLAYDHFHRGLLVLSRGSVQQVNK